MVVNIGWPDDTELVVDLKMLIGDLPSYGYRRARGLMRRKREAHA